jgi:hypothetical protein
VIGFPTERLSRGSRLSESKRYGPKSADQTYGQETISSLTGALDVPPAVAEQRSSLATALSPSAVAVLPSPLYAEALPPVAVAVLPTPACATALL